MFTVAKMRAELNSAIKVDYEAKKGMLYQLAAFHSVLWRHQRNYYGRKDRSHQ